MTVWRSIKRRARRALARISERFRNSSGWNGAPVPVRVPVTTRTR